MKIIILTLTLLLCAPTLQAQVTRGKKAVGDNNTTVRPTTQGRADVNFYNSLLKAKENVESAITNLQNSLPAGASASKQRKMNKLMAPLIEQKAIIQRQIDAIPESIKSPEIASQRQKQQREALAQELIERAATLDASKQNQEQVYSQDSELDALYRGYVEQQESSFDPSEVVYRVLFAITKKPDSKMYKVYKDVYEQRMAGGKTAYYQGNYRSKAQAEQACVEILAKGKYRDAFVVAMVGDKRLPLK